MSNWMLAVKPAEDSNDDNCDVGTRLRCLFASSPDSRPFQPSLFEKIPLKLIAPHIAIHDRRSATLSCREMHEAIRQCSYLAAARLAPPLRALQALQHLRDRTRMKLPAELGPALAEIGNVVTLK